MTTPLEAQLQRIQDYAEDTPHIGTLSTLRRLHELTHLLQKIQQIMIRREENNPKPNLDNLLEIHLLEIGALCWKWGCENTEGTSFQNLIKLEIHDNFPTILNSHGMTLRMLQLVGKISGEAKQDTVKYPLTNMLFHVLTWLDQEKEKETQK